MYKGVPTLEYASIVYDVKSLPNPKSPSFKLSLASINILAGFKSLCIILRLYICFRALDI